MNEFMGYLRWQARGAVRTPSFYGYLLIVLSIVMAVGECPDPWPMVVAILGLTVIMYDMGMIWFRLTMADYRYERDRVINTLKKEQQ
jgi:hypothetical protein